MWIRSGSRRTRLWRIRRVTTDLFIGRKDQHPQSQRDYKYTMKSATPKTGSETPAKTIVYFPWRSNWNKTLIKSHFLGDSSWASFFVAVAGWSAVFFVIAAPRGGDRLEPLTSKWNLPRLRQTMFCITLLSSINKLLFCFAPKITITVNRSHQRFRINAKLSGSIADKKSRLRNKNKSSSQNTIRLEHKTK